MIRIFLQVRLRLVMHRTGPDRTGPDRIRSEPYGTESASVYKEPLETDADVFAESLWNGSGTDPKLDL